MRYLCLTLGGAMVLLCGCLGALALPWQTENQRTETSYPYHQLEDKARPDLPHSLSPSYYMVVYAAQDRGNIAETSHCFATFARVAPMGESSRGRVELHHINWFSIRGHQTGLANVTEPDGRSSHPEPGENRPTHEALSLVHRHGLRITRWGPYKIDQRLFERAQWQIDLLEGRVPGRRVLYKAFDLGYREGPWALAVNCIHAVSDIDREHTPLRTWASYGDEAARKIVLHLRRWIQEPVVENPGNWELIWEATWQGVPIPAGLEVVRGEPPWERQTTRWR